MTDLVKLFKKVRNCLDEDKQMSYLETLDQGMILELAKSKNAGPLVLKKLSTFDSISIRHEVAKNKNCPGDLLEELAKDEDMLVRDYARATIRNAEKEPEEESKG